VHRNSLQLGIGSAQILQLLENFVSLSVGAVTLVDLENASSIFAAELFLDAQVLEQPKVSVF
jgi:hypothetical protein